MNDKARGQLSGLAGRLVADGLITAAQAEEAQRQAVLERVQFVHYLVAKMGVNGQRLAELASHEFGVPLFDIRAFSRRLIPDGLVDVDLVTKHHALPLFRRGNRLFIALSDPTNLAALDEIKFHTGINTDAILIEESALNKVINEWVETQDTLADGLQGLDAEELEGIDVGPGEGAGDDEGGEAVDETPIVRFVNKVLIDAIKQGASDIHFEPYELRK